MEKVVDQSRSGEGEKVPGRGQETGLITADSFAENYTGGRKGCKVKKVSSETQTLHQKHFCAWAEQEEEKLESAFHSSGNGASTGLGPCDFGSILIT
jgi:hypothetical protein